MGEGEEEHAANGVNKAAGDDVNEEKVTPEVTPPEASENVRWRR